MSSRPLARLLGVLGALALTSACDSDGPKHRLEGSLTQVMDLGYDEARILLAPTDVSLVFVRITPLETAGDPDGGSSEVMQGVSEDYPLKIAWQLEGAPLDGGRLDLTEGPDAGPQRTALSRNVQNDPRNTFPRIGRGSLFFDRVPLPGETVHGDFHITFENGTDVSSGRTVFSKSFTAQVQP